jgi:hypothetical protein
VIDRWHQLASAIQASNLPASDKSVFRYLLDRADYGSAVMPDRFTPTEVTVGLKTSYSRRQVQYSVAHLRRHGWLVTKRAGRRLAYEFCSGAMCDCTGRRHRPQTGATESPDKRNGCAGTSATDRRNAAGQTTVSTERQREGRVGRKPERESGPVLCSVCRTPMDPVLPANGYRTHPNCDPDETPATAGQPGPDLLALQDRNPSRSASVQDQRPTRPRPVP